MFHQNIFVNPFFIIVIIFVVFAPLRFRPHNVHKLRIRLQRQIIDEDQNQ